MLELLPNDRVVAICTERVEAKKFDFDAVAAFAVAICTERVEAKDP